ncbi:MAG: GDSL-type esterase/lipase family protein [Bryobacteraceae bacterium]
MWKGTNVTIRNLFAMAVVVGFSLRAPAGAQPPQPSPAVIAPQDLVALCQRLTTLMDAGGVSVPDLQRAAAPVVESTRQTCIQVQLRPNRSEPSYSLYSNLRAYLALADAVPKPFPFPEAAQKQFAELRDASTRIDLHFRALLDFNDRRLTSSDPANIARYAEANRRAGNPDAAKPRVVFFGDSITDYWRLNEYFPETDYLNRGIAGQTTGELLQRMKPDVIDLRPQAVLILVGTNDLARGITPDAIEKNYAVMADLAAANKIKVMFASVLPVSDYHKDQNPANERTPGRPPAYILQLNVWLKEFCAKHNATYVDYFPAIADNSGFFQAELSDDGLHPNNKGYRVMAPIALAAIQKTVAPPPPDLQKPKRRGFPSILGR